MRICVLANALSVHTQRWARAYAERGHEVHVLGIRWTDIPGVRVHAVCAGRGNSRSIAWTFLSYVRLLLNARRRLKLLAPDVVNAHFTVTHGVIAAVSGFHPTLLCAWGSDVIWRGVGKGPWYFRGLNRYAIKKADLIASTSKFMLEHVRAFAPPGKEIVQVPFGVDCQAFCPGEPHEDEATREFNIGFVKSLSPNYGPDVLIRAMSEVVKAIPKARLVMAGAGPMRYELERLVDDLGLEQCVEFLGFIPHHRVPDLMRRLDIFVNCSDTESFGVVVLEASACGLPVVATDVGGVSEVCRDGETGLMVAPGDIGALAQAIIRMAHDKDLRDRMSRAGRRFVLDNYVWNDNVQDMLGHLDRLSRSNRAV